MPSVVVDASFLVDALAVVPGPYHALEAALTAGHELHAVHVIDLEVIQGMRRAVMTGGIDAVEAARRLDIFTGIRVQRHSHVPHVARIWALRENIKPYDAAYVALAESLDIPLWTRDARLARSAGHTARIEFIA